MNGQRQASSEADPVARDDEFAFGPFRLLPAQRLLLEEGSPVALGGRAFDILVALAERAGTPIGKRELIAKTWPSIFVDESNLRVHVAALRRALRDGQADRRFIITLPGRGYSLVGPVLRTAQKPGAARPTIHATATDNLPMLVRKTVGRDETVAALTAKLVESRFVTIVGPGGIGKTTVALSVAAGLRSFGADGVWLLDLATISDPTLMPTALALVLGTPVSSLEPIPHLLTVLRDKRILLVFDNCEHVIDGAATLAEQIFRNAPNVHILATSREALRVEGENIWRLSSLEVPPEASATTAKVALKFSAVQLFVQRVSAMSASFELTDSDAPIVGEICRRLDGIPLAIELAASRVESLGVRGVAARLGDRFRLLTRGYRTAVPRHQTLRATFDWSYGLLDWPARIVLGRLALLAGDFTLDAACAVARCTAVDDAEIENQVITLVAASLLTMIDTEDVVRYRLLDSTRAYAQERLNESGEAPKIFRQHAGYLLQLLEGAAQQLKVWPLVEWLAEYGRQIDNVRTSLDWAFSLEGDVELGVNLTIAAAPLFLLTSLHHECRSRVTAALAHLQPDELGAGRRAMQLWAELGGALMYTLHRDLEVFTAWTRALEIAESLGAVDYKLRALKGLWTSAFNAGDLTSANSYAERFDEVSETLADPAYTQLSARMLAMTDQYSGRLEAARKRCATALAAYRDVNIQLDLIRFQFDQRTILATILSMTLWMLGKPDQAGKVAQSCLDYAREADHDLSVIFGLSYTMIKVDILSGNIDAAEDNLNLLTKYTASNPTGQFGLMCQCWRGSLLSRKESFVAAADLLKTTLRNIPYHSYQAHYTWFLGEYAYAAGRAGEVDEAIEAIDRALEICDRLSERWNLAELLRIKGEIALMRRGADSEASAEDCLERSLDCARQQGALSWELRAAMSLLRLDHGRGRISQAYSDLATVYGRFTEGFETYDLLEAKRLLDRLK
ncbi:winged helix-turn-helix domain-containing protein (plasmid) [Roseomonas sp. CCTCC AB2023176]|uniref:ATP-binding protein n=1 Tax=Roseomonas sp. CCTCC AB2023176 TaxID=3342640 RepID=UPI0035DF609E